MPWLPDGMHLLRSLPRVVHPALWPLDPTSAPGAGYEGHGYWGTRVKERRDYGTKIGETCGCGFKPQRRVS